MIDPEGCDSCPLLFCDSRNPLCIQTPEFKLFLIRETQRQEAEIIVRDLKRVANAEQLKQARLTQKRKRAGRKGYAAGLGPYKERQRKLNSYGMKKYDGRIQRLVK